MVPMGNRPEQHWGVGVGAQQGDGRTAVGQDKDLSHLSSLRPWTSPASCSEPEDLGLNFTQPLSSCVEMSQAANLSEPVSIWKTGIIAATS